MDSADILYQVFLALGSTAAAAVSIYTLWYNTIGKKNETSRKEFLESIVTLKETISELKTTIQNISNDFHNLEKSISELKHRVDKHGEQIDKDHDELISIKSRMKFCQVYKKETEND